MREFLFAILLVFVWTSLGLDCNTDDFCDINCVYNRTLGVLCQWGCRRVLPANHTNEEDLAANITLDSDQQRCMYTGANESCLFNNTFSEQAWITILLEVFNATHPLTALYSCQLRVNPPSIVRYSEPENVTLYAIPSENYGWSIDVAWSLPVDYALDETNMRLLSRCFVRWSQDYSQWVKIQAPTEKYYYNIDDIHPGSRYDVQVTCICTDSKLTNAENWSANVTYVIPSLLLSTSETNSDVELSTSMDISTQHLAVRTPVPSDISSNLDVESSTSTEMSTKHSSAKTPVSSDTSSKAGTSSGVTPISVWASLSTTTDSQDQSDSEIIRAVNISLAFLFLGFVVIILSIVVMRLKLFGRSSEENYQNYDEAPIDQLISDPMRIPHSQSREQLIDITSSMPSDETTAL